METLVDCKVLSIEQYKKMRDEARRDEMVCIFVALGGTITEMLTHSIDYSNVDYVIGYMLEKAEDMKDIFKNSGEAAERAKRYPELYKKRIYRAKEIRETARRMMKR